MFFFYFLSESHACVTIKIKTLFRPYDNEILVEIYFHMSLFSIGTTVYFQFGTSKQGLGSFSIFIFEGVIFDKELLI
jgi:hypothetical protein